jgi:hypothetical protein
VALRTVFVREKKEDRHTIHIATREVLQSNALPLPRGTAYWPPHAFRICMAGESGGTGRGLAIRFVPLPTQSEEECVGSAIGTMG